VDAPVDASVDAPVDAPPADAPPVDAPPVDALPVDAPPVEIDAAGMTWQVFVADPINGVVQVGCEPPNGGPGCDPQHGDTPCSAALPVLCKKATTRPAPVGAVDWSGNQVALTLAVSPTAAGLTTLAAVNAYCATQLGAEWTVAERHDGPGRSFTAYGDLGDVDRFWVDINNHPDATCWR
jgi:hypothetical protein